MRDGTISRRAALSMLASAAWAQQQIPYRDYSRCLPDFLRHLATESVKKRNEAIGQLTTAEAIAARRQWVRRTFWEISGKPPGRTPLNVRTTGGFTRSGYRVEKIVYETQPELFVPANLYIPTGGSAPYPGVLFQMGHSLNGKAAVVYQKCCQGLAQLGFVVLGFDPMGQGERTYYPRPESTLTRLRSADDEHTVPGQQLLLLGLSATWLQAWDSVRSLDVLASHPLVDPKRLASTGNSGGGTTTMFLAAADDRLAAAAPSCPNTENFACEDFNPPGSTDDAEQDFAGSGALGFDRWDLLYPFAPKPLLVLVSAKDFFGTYSPRYMQNGRAEFAKLAAVYRTLGKAEQIAWWESPLPHGLNYSARMRIYHWFRRWLKDDRTPLEAEPPVNPERDETLWVTEKGNTVRSLGSARPLDLARARPQTPADLKQLLHLEEIPARPRRVKIAEAPSEGCTIEAMEVATATHVWVPGWVFHPPKSDGVTILLHPSGRNASWGEGGLCHQLAQAGITVCAPDVRGIGDLTAEAGRGALRYTLPHANEHNYAWAGVILGQSLLAQRVTDLITLIRTFRGEKVTVAALGKMTVPALFAAALEPVEKLYLAGGLASYRHLLEVEEYPHPFANFLPGVLLHTDLPRIAASLRNVTVGGLVDGAGKRLAAAEVTRLYPKATVLPDEAWTTERLSRL
ncbi:MAG: acetylxylan esterase [Bryobacterales bacterium]|nr:acetylxylan esterase [Bryobacterales bacterium]